MTWRGPRNGTGRDGWWNAAVVSDDEQSLPHLLQSMSDVEGRRTDTLLLRQRIASRPASPLGPLKVLGLTVFITESVL